MNTASAPIRLSDIAVELGGRPILRGIDLSIDSGEFVALLGANGSGKSTLVRTTLGLIPTTRGEVRLFGSPLADFKQWHRVGFVPQRNAATSGVPASVWEVVASGRLSRRRLITPLRRRDRDAIDRAINAVGLGGREDDGCSTLSGGQQQRALIARALAGEPELLVLDEPTAGVDLLSQESFAEVLANLKNSGTTIALVAHELGPLEPLIDRAIVMQDGRITYDGAPIPAFHEAAHHHGHHHPELAEAGPSDHVPGVASPFDETRGRA
jgi:zinc transport system ATP-binding protein